MGPPVPDRNAPDAVAVLRQWQLGAAAVAVLPSLCFAVAWKASGPHLLVPAVTAFGVLSSAWQARRERGHGLLSVAWPIVWWPLLYLAPVDAVSVDPSRYIDETLKRWDAVLLATGAEHMPRWTLGGPLEELANVFYVGFYLVVPLNLLGAWMRRGEEAALRHGLALLLGLAACSVIWLIIPSGGYHETGSPLSPGWGPATEVARWIYRMNPHYAAAFPSSHVALSVASATVVAREGGTRLWFIFALGVCFATVYGQYHYLVDVPPGFVIGLAAGWVATAVGRRPRGEGSDRRPGPASPGGTG